jgi:hypothetical protein
MPVTQPPYDATRFSLRQTSGEIGVFSPFTSAPVGRKYPLAAGNRRMRPGSRFSVLSYIFFTRSTFPRQGEVDGGVSLLRIGWEIPAEG